MLRRVTVFLLCVWSPVAAARAIEVETGRSTVVRRPIESMIAIPAGTFTMGATAEQQSAALAMCREEIGARHAQSCQPELFLVEGPQRTVYLSAFSIDRVEVTVDAYRACVRAGGCTIDPLLQTDRRLLEEPSTGRPLPITSVTWSEAERFCHARGARLPSEAEWERAARGRDGRLWPWGNLPRDAAFNHGRFLRSDETDSPTLMLVRPDASDGWTFLAPVGSFPQGASPDGVLDMAGNAMEWTGDLYQEEPPQRGSTVNPHGPATGPLRSLRGGSWRQPPFFQRTTARDAAPPDTRSPEIGFRCAQ